IISPEGPLPRASAPKPNPEFLRKYHSELGTNIAQRFEKDPFEQQSPSRTIGQPIQAPGLSLDRSPGFFHATFYPKGVRKQFGPITAVASLGPQGITGSISAAGISMPLSKILAGEVWKSGGHKLAVKNAEAIKRAPLPEKAPADSTWL